MAKTSKSKTPKPPKKIITEFYCVNITIQSSTRSGPEMYERIFRQIFSNRQVIDIGHGKGMCLKEMNLYESETNGGKFKYFQGEMAKFSLIETDDWLDLTNMIKTTHDLPSNLFPNLVISEYVFIPEAHRFYFKSTSKVTVNNVVDFFKTSLKDLIGENEQFAVNEMTSKDLIERILKADVLVRLEVDISYTNNDLGSSSAKEALDKLFKVADAAKAHIVMTPADKSKGLDTSSTLVKGLVELTHENGVAKATIKEAGRKRAIPISTKNHPEKIPVETEKNGLPFWELVKKIILKRRSDGSSNN